MAVIILKLEKGGLTKVLHPKDADRMANSVDPDQTASGALSSGSTLFAQICLSKNLGSIR